LFLEAIRNRRNEGGGISEGNERYKEGRNLLCAFPNASKIREEESNFVSTVSESVSEPPLE
jgi:hypothetical protein